MNWLRCYWPSFFIIKSVFLFVMNYSVWLNCLLLGWSPNGEFENSILPSMFISGTSYCKKKNPLYVVYGTYFYHHGLMDSYFMQWVIGCSYPLVWCSNYSRIGQWESFQAGFSFSLSWPILWALDYFLVQGIPGSSFIFPALLRKQGLNSRCPHCYSGVSVPRPPL